MIELRGIKHEPRQALRLLKLLAKYSTKGVEANEVDDRFYLHTNARKFTFPQIAVTQCLRIGFVKREQGALLITEIGIIALKRAIEPQLDCSKAGQQYAKVSAPNHSCGEGKHSAVQNVNESPLSRLYHRRTKQGTRYLSSVEFEAGERLRQDFERAQMQPNITANYSAVASPSRAGAGKAAMDISDFALDAKRRFSKATNALGPEFSGLTIDICCFLKGLETIERERSWPPRSAKLMLKTGLSILARHYGLIGFANQAAGQITHWNSSDYRPSIG